MACVYYSCYDCGHLERYPMTDKEKPCEACGSTGGYALEWEEENEHDDDML